MTKNPQSTASVAGHPIHPMLIPFPIAFFVGTFVCDLVFWGTANTSWADATLWLLGAGLIMAALAAVAGLTDFLGEPKIRNLSTAWWHAGGNVVAVLIELANWLVRYYQGSAAILPTGIILSAIVVCGLLFTGWKGWELVYRGHVGIADDLGTTEPTWIPRAGAARPCGAGTTCSDDPEHRRNPAARSGGEPIGKKTPGRHGPPCLPGAILRTTLQPSVAGADLGGLHGALGFGPGVIDDAVPTDDGPFLRGRTLVDDLAVLRLHILHDPVLGRLRKGWQRQSDDEGSGQDDVELHCCSLPGVAHTPRNGLNRCAVPGGETPSYTAISDRRVGSRLAGK
jgi:uncharacterized membrane protein